MVRSARGGSFTVVDFFGGGPGSLAAKGRCSCFSSSKAWRKLTPSARITQSNTLPPSPHSPLQCHTFCTGSMHKLGFRSSWNGHNPMSSLPRRFSFTPRASARRSRETSRFSRLISSSGIRAILLLSEGLFPAFSENLSRPSYGILYVPYDDFNGQRVLRGCLC